MPAISLKQRAVRAYLSDGLFEITSAFSCLLLWAITWYTTSRVASLNACLYLAFLCGFAAWNSKLLPRMKERAVYPRLGYVASPYPERGFRARLVRVACCFAAALLMYIYVTSHHVPIWFAINAPALIVLGVTFIDLYRRSGLYRFAAIGAFLIGAGGAFALDPAFRIWSRHGTLLWLAFAIVFATTGVWSFSKMMRLPVTAEEVRE